MASSSRLDRFAVLKRGMQELLARFGRVFRRVVGYVEGKDAVALPSQGGYNCPSYHYGDTENDVAEDGMDD